MQPFPETTPLSENPQLSGHLWIQELVTGRRLWFQVAPSGMMTFGVENEKFDVKEEIPLQYRPAAAHVREEFDLEALRKSVDDEDTESITFFGVATLYEGIEYDWSELPPFLGVDIWSDEQDAYLSPDAATRAYGSLGLSALPAVKKEASAKYTDLQGYASGEDSMPPSEWYDGPAAGVLVRDKSGGRGEAWREEVGSGPDSDAANDTPEELVDRYVTEERIERTVARLADTEEGPTVDAVLEMVMMDAVREEYSNLYRDDDCVVSEKEFRSAVAERVQRRLR